MDLLKKENWFIWLILYFFANNTTFIVLGAVAGLFDKKAWYAKWQYWFIGLIFFGFPAFIMFMILSVQMLCKLASKFEIPGKELYELPYTWIVLIIVPIFGWILMSVLVFYLQIMILISLYEGKGESITKR